MTMIINNDKYELHITIGGVNSNALIQQLLLKIKVNKQE